MKDYSELVKTGPSHLLHGQVRCIPPKYTQRVWCILKSPSMGAMGENGQMAEAVCKVHIYMCTWRSQVHITTFIWRGFCLCRRIIIRSLSFIRSFIFTIPSEVPFVSAFPAHHLYRFSWRFRSPSRFRSPTRWLIFVFVLGPSSYRQGITILVVHIFLSHLLRQQGWDYFIKLQSSCIATYCNNQNIPQIW